LLAHTDYPHKLILVDNGSTDGVGEFFDSVPGAIAVHSPANRGFAGGANLGLVHAEGHVLVLNSDTLVPAKWLSRLVAALESAPYIGMVGPMSNYVSGPQLIDGLSFTSMDEINAFADQLAENRRGCQIEVERLVGFCLLIRDVAFRDVGLFDESFGFGNFEDDDYCLRVRKAGYRLCIAEDCFVFHYGNRTFAAMDVVGERFIELLRANEARFKAKWNLDDNVVPRAQQVSLNLNREARACVERGDFPEAARLLKEAIAACPILEQNLNDLGAVLWTLGERDTAFECFSRAVKLNPDYAQARANLVDAAQLLDREAEADKLLTSISSLGQVLRP
jgi:hypothetical protein